MTCQIPEQIYKMAGFTDDATAPGCTILGPVIGWNSTGIDGNDKRFGDLYAGQELLHPQDVRSKTAIETDHDL